MLRLSGLELEVDKHHRIDYSIHQIRLNTLETLHKCHSHRPFEDFFLKKKLLWGFDTMNFKGIKLLPFEKQPQNVPPQK